MPDERSLAAAAAATPLASEPEARYRSLTQRIGQLLPTRTWHNPGITNYHVELMGRDFQGPYLSDMAIRRLRMVPKAAIIGGHGGSNNPSWVSPSNPAGATGFFPDAKMTNEEIAKLLWERHELASTNRAAFRMADRPGLSLAEAAKAIGPGTNDVELAAILSCYRGGCTPEEVATYFPNVKQVVMSDPQSSTSDLYVAPMFQSQRDPKLMQRPYTAGPGGENIGTNFYMQNWVRDGTNWRSNPIYQKSDWNTNRWPAFMDLPHVSD